MPTSSRAKKKNPTETYTVPARLDNFDDPSRMESVYRQYLPVDGGEVELTDYLKQEISHATYEASRALHSVIASASSALKELEDGRLWGRHCTQGIIMGAADANGAINRLVGLTDATLNNHHTKRREAAEAALHTEAAQETVADA
jgi:hypothetical protein